MPLQPHTPLWDLGPQLLDWVSPSRKFSTTVALFDSQPNYEHEVAIALDTGIKYQGIGPIVGGWAYATGVPGPIPAPTPPAVNDSFTILLLEFDGIEGSTTYNDTNGAGWPRKWTQVSGNGKITNVGEKFYSGALMLDGQTVITAPDSVDLTAQGRDFTIRGWFLCDFPLGERRTLAGKSDQTGSKFILWLDRLEGGAFSVGVGTVAVADTSITDRTGVQVVDRADSNVVSRFDVGGGVRRNELISTTLYSNTLNTGWHQFEATRLSDMLHLRMDGVLEASVPVTVQQIALLPGPLTIGGYGPPKNGVFDGNPWIGGFDRFAVDIGIAR